MADYSKLKAVLDAAYDQSARGKGKARHANGRDFDRQPILEIGRMVGPGYALGQSMKKSQEAFGMVSRLDYAAAVQELLGSIVYAAAAVVLIIEHRAEFDRNVAKVARDAEEERERVKRGGLASAPSKFETPLEARSFTDAATRLRDAVGRKQATDTLPRETRGHDGLTHAERIAGLEGELHSAINSVRRTPAGSGFTDGRDVPLP